MYYLLDDYIDDLLWSGNIIRVFIAKKNEFYYTDQVVDLMFFDTNEIDARIGLIIISGSKAGKIALTFPKEAYDEKHCYAIKKEWLLMNIFEYLYLDSNCDKVFVSKNMIVLPFD